MTQAGEHRTKPELNDRDVDLSIWAFQSDQVFSSYSFNMSFGLDKQEVQCVHDPLAKQLLSSLVRDIR